MGGSEVSSRFLEGERRMMRELACWVRLVGVLSLRVLNLSLDLGARVLLSLDRRLSLIWGSRIVASSVWIVSWEGRGRLLSVVPAHENLLREAILLRFDFGVGAVLRTTV